MYLIQHTAFLILLLHQCIVDGFNIFDMDFGLNYLNREINSITSSDASDTDTRWILQEIDHFNSSDKRMFQLKYTEELRYWRENGPIYLFLHYRIPGQDNYWTNLGIMKELAEETHGAMYVTDQRYFGESKPFIDLNTENIKYFNSRQALADIAKLISYLKSLPVYKDSKVVVIGSVNTGNLAAWMKVLYPNLIDVAISSSASVLAQKDFFEFLEKVKNTYEHYGGTECLDKVTKTILNYDSLLQSPEGIKQLKKDENICYYSDMTNIENQQLFFFLKTFHISLISFYGYSMKDYCGSANDKNDYSSFLKQSFNSKDNNSDEDCLIINFQDFVNNLRDQRNYEYSFYPLVYQSCFEFGRFPTTSSKNQPFLNIPLEFYMKICSELFGNSFNENRLEKEIEITNKLYGGLKPNVTKVVFTNGDMDPWSTLGVLKDLSNDVPAVVIPGAFQSEVLYSEDNSDSEELMEARKHVKYLIKKWISVD